MKEKNSSQENRQGLIENFRRANRSIQRRFFALIVFCIVANSIYFSFQVREGKIREFWKARDYISFMKDSTQSNLSSKLYEGWYLEYITGVKKITETIEVDSLKGYRLLDSAERILEQKFDELLPRVEEQDDVSVFGIRVRRYIWNAFAQIVLTVVFLNFCSVLAYRDRLLKKLLKFKVKDTELGVEMYEIYTPYNEYRKSYIPGISSLIFSLFLFFILFTTFILPQRVFSTVFDGVFLTYLNFACLVVIAFKVATIFLRQNLLGTMTLIKTLIGEDYFDKNQKVGIQQILYWSYLFIILNSLLWTGIAFDNYDQFDTVYYGIHRYLDYFLMILASIIGGLFLPLGLAMFKNNSHPAFEAMIFAGAIQHLFILCFVLLDLMNFLHSYKLSYGGLGTIMFILSYGLYLVYALSRKHQGRINYFKKWIEDSF